MTLIDLHALAGRFGLRCRAECDRGVALIHVHHATAANVVAVVTALAAAGVVIVPPEALVFDAEATCARVTGDHGPWTVTVYVARPGPAQALTVPLGGTP